MIGGNTIATVQIKSVTKNRIGESVASWQDVQTLNGFLDMTSGSTNYRNNSTKSEQSTHVFICDYVELDSRINKRNSRMIVNGTVYDIDYIDNPMGLNDHLEIMLESKGDLYEI